MSFWKSLPAGFIGLSPMDGVTDPVYRYIVAYYGKPHLMMTEFTCVEGIAHNALKLLKDFQYDEIERPVCAQVFGTTVEDFYTTAIIVAELGFDGLDINMGCPSKNVSGRGAGAALIRTPELASEIIEACLAGVRDYAKGIISIKDLKIKQKMKEAIYAQIATHPTFERKLIPVSVKTRIGFDAIVVEDWVTHLMKHDIAAISIHGRTLKQMYLGQADWDAITRAATLIKQTDILVVGNGDIDSIETAQQRIQESGVDGVLIGRASFGNPWIFQGREGSLEERISLAIHHCKLWEERVGVQYFFVMRKHLGWYIKGHPNAKEIRRQLMQANNTEEVKSILTNSL